MSLTDENTGPRPRIKITQEIIERATRANSGHCVIADAIKTQCPTASGVMVDLQTVRYTDREKGERYVWLTPTRAQQMLLAFDQGWPIEPTTMQFRPPAQIVPVKVSSKKAAATSAARREELLAKEALGEELTKSERRSIAKIRRDKAAMGSNHVEDRPTTQGRQTAQRIGPEASPDHIGVQVRGGRTPMRAVLAHGQGQRREWGLRVAGVPDPLR